MCLKPENLAAINLLCQGAAINTCFVSEGFCEYYAIDVVRGADLLYPVLERRGMAGYVTVNTP